MVWTETELIVDDIMNGSNYAAMEPWVRIQNQTFTNWVNDKLRPHDLMVDDLTRDLGDGVSLCVLVEALKGGSDMGRIIKRNRLNHHEVTANLGLALEAIKADGVKLVNIGAEDIYAGNQKLILGLVWSLIHRYQIGSQSKLPPKKLMLSWINAVLYPRLQIFNFTSDWNDGVALLGIIEYCRPGTCPDWFLVSSHDRLLNCERAMHLAQEVCGVPMVVSPKDLSSRDLDALSTMTYLSYFMTADSAGYSATLRWVQQQVAPLKVNDFGASWNNGQILCTLVQSLGGNVSKLPIGAESSSFATVQMAMSVSKATFGVDDVIMARDMTNINVDPIGVMAYAAWLQAKALSQRTSVISSPPPFRSPSFPPEIPVRPFLDMAASNAVDPEPEVLSPKQTSLPPSPSAPALTPRAVYGLTVSENVTPPVMIQQPVLVKARVFMTNRWTVGSLATFQVEVSPSVVDHSVKLIVTSASGKQSEIYSKFFRDGIHNFNFNPDEIGEYTLNVFVNDHDAPVSSHVVQVCDPARIQITVPREQLHPGTSVMCYIDCSRVGSCDVEIDVTHNGLPVPHTTRVGGKGEKKYRIDFLPRKTGVYRMSVVCSGVSVPGSPFDIVVADKVVLYPIIAHGDGLNTVLVDRETSFKVDTGFNFNKLLECTIINPQGSIVPHSISSQTSGQGHRIMYKPTEEGVHQIVLCYDDRPVSGSPFSVRVRRGVIHVRNMTKVIYLGTKSQFTVDASEKTKGKLEIDSDIPVFQVHKTGHNMYQVSLLPRRAGRHDLVIKYNEEIVPGSPFIIEVHGQKQNN